MKCLSLFLVTISLLVGVSNASARMPNIIVILADDLGYGDLGCYGSPGIRTPNLDRMAADGLRFTDFYSAAEVCTPSRAGLLTGRYPIRSGMAGARRVLFPKSPGGLPQEEITIARALKQQGYATGHVGKWHLGIHPGGRPGDHGFDYSFGLPYSNDMELRPGVSRTAFRSANPPADGWLVPIMLNGKVFEKPADQTTLTRRYTEEAVKFIREHKSSPFFLYFAHTFPHVPLFASPAFKGKSRRGIYGDTVEEIDWSVGQVMDALQKEGISDNTLVFFTSDNGPSLGMKQQGGSAGPLRDGKGSTWEGGLRVPGIAWWPGTIAPGITGEPANGMDLFATALTLGGASIPTDREIDGRDLSPLLLEGKALPERPFFYYRLDKLFACRLGNYKAHYFTMAGHGAAKADAHEPPLLFDLGTDLGESFDIAAEHPDILKKIQAAVAEHQRAMVPGKPQL